MSTEGARINPHTYTSKVYYLPLAKKFARILEIEFRDIRNSSIFSGDFYKPPVTAQLECPPHNRHCSGL